MNVRKRQVMIVNVILTMLSLSLFSGCSGCLGSPEFEIIFENRSQQTLIIYYGDYEVGTVDTESTITYDRAGWDTGQYPIEAINLQGETVYSKTLTREMMEKIDTMVYKVVITSSDNSTFKNE